MTTQALINTTTILVDGAVQKLLPGDLIADAGTQAAVAAAGGQLAPYSNTTISTAVGLTQKLRRSGAAEDTLGFVMTTAWATVGAQGSGGSTVGGGNIIYREGEPSPAGNVYATDWDAYAAAAMLNFACTMEVDTSLVEGTATWSVDQPIAGMRVVNSANSPPFSGLVMVDGTNPNTGDPTVGMLVYPSAVDGLAFAVFGSAPACVMITSASEEGDQPTQFFISNAPLAGMFYCFDGNVGVMVDAPTPPTSGNHGVVEVYIDRCSVPFNVEGEGPPGIGLFQEYTDLAVFFFNMLPIPGQVTANTIGAIYSDTSLDVFFDSTFDISQCEQAGFPGEIEYAALTEPTDNNYHVDITGRYNNANGSIGNGSLFFPFNKIQSAIDALKPNQTEGSTNQSIRISAGFALESLTMRDIDNVSFIGEGANNTQIYAQSGSAFSWVVEGNTGYGTPPANVLFDGIGFSAGDGTSNVVVFDGSWGNGGALGNVNMRNTVINANGSGMCLVTTQATVQMYGDAQNFAINATGQFNPCVVLNNSGLNVTGDAAINGTITCTVDYSSPVSQDLAFLQVQNGATINGLVLFGTPIVLIGPYGNIQTISAPEGNLTMTHESPLGDMGPVILVGGLLGSPLGTVPATSIQMPDATGYTPQLGPSFASIGAATVWADLSIGSDDASGLLCGFQGVSFPENNLAGGPFSITLGNNVAFDVRNANITSAFDQLIVSGTNAYFIADELEYRDSLTGPGTTNTVTFGIPPGITFATVTIAQTVLSTSGSTESPGDQNVVQKIISWNNYEGTGQPGEFAQGVPMGYSDDNMGIPRFQGLGGTGQAVIVYSTPPNIDDTTVMGLTITVQPKMGR